MKTKIILFSLAILQLLVISVNAQYFVYNDTVSSGMWTQGADVKEEYSNRDAFSFEDSTIVDQVWAKWENDGAADMTVIDTDGANGTTNSLEVSFSTAGEVQIFTNQATLDVNASIDKTKTYVLSFWAKASETTTITAALENPEPWVSFLWQDQEIGTDWVKYTFDIDPSTREYDGTADNVYVKVKMVPENASTEIWFDEFSLKQIGFDGEVANPVSDAVNSSDKCAMSSTDGNWQQIQYFPTFTPTDGDHIFFSVYNPNNAGPGQVQFEYSSAPDAWHYVGDVSYEEGSLTGWVEYSIDLSAHVGNEINKVIIMPAGDNASAVYLDNVYFSANSLLTSADEQNIVYNDTISSGIWFQGTNGAEVANPISDAVNSSDSCAMSATDGNWQQIQYFPTYTPKSGDKLFFSIYNPNNAGPGQVQFEYSSDPDAWHYVGDVSYEEGSLTGWVEYSIDLSAHVGNEINKVIIMPAGDNASAVYLDNVYFSANSLLTSADEQNIVYNDTISSGIWFQGTNGAEVANPISDAVNSSDSCAMSATDGNWQQIQYFPTYTPKSGDKLFFSIYNPNNAGPGQVQFEYSSDPDSWHYVGDVSYEEGSLTGWVEYSIDLSAHVGNEINKVIIMPAGDNPSAVYLDNVYFSANSLLTSADEQNIVYNDTISSGIWFQGTNGAEVVNPISDAVNSSDSCAMSATDGNWQQIQYFPTFTPSEGDHFFFSVYNPNNAGPGQVQFEYSSDPDAWHYVGDVTYEEGSLTGWVEYSIDLSAHVGNEINKVIIMPAGDNASAVYLDNVYFGANSLTVGILKPVVNDDHIYFDGYGRITFDKNQSNTEVHVYDISGRLLMRETIRGTKSSGNLKKKGIYILKIKKESSISGKKLIFN